jgi:hypothetical protein
LSSRRLPGCLTEPSEVEQRCDAVAAIIRDGLSVTETAEKFGVSRQTLHGGWPIALLCCVRNLASFHSFRQSNAVRITRRHK